MRTFEDPGRSLVVSKRGMAATSHPLSTLAAIEILKDGGNAMDAAVGACAVQCVVEPGSTGIGGDCFAMYAPRGVDNIIAFNGSGRAPRAASTEYYIERGIKTIERNSPHAVTVPGAVEAWERLLKDHGTLDLAQVLQPAIELANDGYSISPRVHYDWSRQAALLGKTDSAKGIFLPDGKVPETGSTHYQRELALTLKAIADGGARAFYEGQIAEDIVRFLRGLGGLHSVEDFAETEGEYVDTIRTKYRGYDVVECPPNGQGIIALLILNILSRFKVEGDPLDINRLHLEAEASRLAYDVRDRYVADNANNEVPVEWMLSDQLAEELAASIDSSRAASPLPRPQPPAHSDTVYIAVVDRDRNAASFINSIFTPFGSGLVCPKTGVLFHNRGQGFVIEKGHINTIEGGRRPLHTIIPGMLVRDGKVLMPFGVMGGQYQALGHARLLSLLLDYNLDLQTAIDMPRLFPRPNDGKVELERLLFDKVGAELARRGFSIDRAATPIGGAQAIWIDWEKGSLLGGSDPRKDGCALGY
jgi:gamma-glutamyltranspeptidase / glutathione hydrolase